MPLITKEYLQQLPEIYRDLLSSFPTLEPGRRSHYGLAVQTLYEHLRDKYDLGQVLSASQQMAIGGAVELKRMMFVHPTDLGEEIIAGLTGHEAPSASPPVPPFPVPQKG